MRFISQQLEEVKSCQLCLNLFKSRNNASRGSAYLSYLATWTEKAIIGYSQKGAMYPHWSSFQPDAVHIRNTLD